MRALCSANSPRYGEISCDWWMGLQSTLNLKLASVNDQSRRTRCCVRGFELSIKRRIVVKFLPQLIAVFHYHCLNVRGYFVFDQMKSIVAIIDDIFEL